MFRLFFVLPFVFILTSNFGASHPVSQSQFYDLKMDLNKKIGDLETNFQGDLTKRIRNLNNKISELKTNFQGLTNRMNGARVHCENKATHWNVGSEKTIMYLDRQDVDCPHSYFLARFRLGREGHFSLARVRYYYRCCRFVL